MDEVGRPYDYDGPAIFLPFLRQIRDKALLDGYTGIRLWLHLSDTTAKSLFVVKASDVRWSQDLVTYPDEVWVYVPMGDTRMSRCIKRFKG